MIDPETDGNAGAGAGARPRILFLDAYDSFSNNVVALLTEELGADVEILPIDSPHFFGGLGGGNDREKNERARTGLRAALRHYDAVVCGPGPGSPDSAAEVGIMRYVWALASSPEEEEEEEGTRCGDGDGHGGVVPALGICLGFQSLVLACGGGIRRLRSGGLHGMVRAIDHVGLYGKDQQKQEKEIEVETETVTARDADIFRGVPPFRATLYHSLRADVGEKASEARWTPPTHLPNLVPLAWTHQENEDVDAHILMAARHRTKPFWGLQYHPESICTDPAGRRVIQNWFADAARWNRVRGREIRRAEPSPLLSAGITRCLPRWSPSRVVLPSSVPVDSTAVAGANGDGNGLFYDGGREGEGLSHHPFSAWLESDSPLAALGRAHTYYYRTVDLPSRIEVPDVVEVLQGAPRRQASGGRSGSSGRKGEFVVLDSASANANADADTSRIGPDVRGRYSIVALDVDEALKLEYRVGDRYVTARRAIVDTDTDFDTDTTGAHDKRGRLCPSDSESEKIELGAHATVWQFLGDFWAQRRLSLTDGAEGRADGTSPFIGGFMGYVTYELGLEGIDVGVESRTVGPAGQAGSRPDLCFAWVTRSVVLDHLEGKLRVQILAPASSSVVAAGWLDSVVDELTTSAVWTAASETRYRYDHGPGEPTPPLTPTKTAATGTGMGTRPRTMTTVTRNIATPDPGEYEAKVRTCQEYIAAGHSYELCLTDRTTVTTAVTRVMSPAGTIVARSNGKGRHSDSRDEHQEEVVAEEDTSWTLYRALRRRQPAPFGSYVRLGGATLVSSSPERFLEHGAVDDEAGALCSMRPMKGTVRKKTSSADGDGSGGGGGGGVSTLEEAQRLLRVPKEEAENLMIVDLVRHDLHGVCGAAAASVSVPRLLGVEEYASVFQMVSVVEGRLPGTAATSISSAVATNNNNSNNHASIVTGLDVLAASLPPGSMTGAPKKRSCEILREIEGRAGERSLYSGVVGYMDAAGRGDWSVTIRSMFRWDDEVVVRRRGDNHHDDRLGCGIDDDDDEGAGGGDRPGVREEKWHIGAGGAVTALSTPEGETEEMLVKLRGPLGVFREAGP